jgi:hypothetical protein
MTESKVPSMWFGWVVATAATAVAAWVTFGLKHAVGAGIAGLVAGFLIGVCIYKAQDPTDRISAGQDGSNFLVWILALGITIWAMFFRDHAAWAGFMGLITGLFVIMATAATPSTSEP